MLVKSRCDKKVVLDTSVILYDALAVKNFHKTDIFIPLSVIEEVDRFKRDMGENGRNARQFSRFMDTLRSQGSLTQGVALKDCGSYMYVNMLAEDKKDWPAYLDNKKVDNQILGTAIYLQKQFPSASVELISKDINLRVRSDVFNVKSRDYDPDRVANIADMYSGIRQLEITKKELESFF